MEWTTEQLDHIANVFTGVHEVIALAQTAAGKVDPVKVHRDKMVLVTLVEGLKAQMTPEQGKYLTDKIGVDPKDILKEAAQLVDHITPEYEGDMKGWITGNL